MIEHRPYFPEPRKPKLVKDHNFDDLELYWDYKNEPIY